ncbi:protein EPD1 [Echria macrotheca]|uniref:1,3-beta-glucanosyltransferase n=1 Tax=Echria macrotheca TaxID=438768 RepID=A0AAJ0BEV5_9PEZI|nr:protein EPD1 [Echria macrotheca]
MRVTQTAVVASSLLLGQASAALPHIVAKGTKFFYENGTQFYMKGIAYQQDSAAGGASTGNNKYTDPLADPAACKRDIPLLQALNTNTIRTYAIDPTKDHSQCMKMLDDAGIYVVSDLSEPSLSVNRDDPKWDIDLYKRYTAVVDELGQYSNVIGFFAGNEVTNNNTNTPASAFVKAAVRDTKAHIAKQFPNRWLGVGYAANDDPDIRDVISYYFNCGNQSEAIDFWGYNIYSWCGHSSMETSGYSKQVEFFKNYSVPVFFAEYGCNKPDGASRIWEETTALYSSDMTDVFSGGIVYMYFEEANDYGIVSVSGGQAVTQKDYGPLQTRLASATPSSTDASSYQPTNKPQACPEITKDWQVKGELLPPTPDETLCECMFNSLSCVPASGLSTKNYKPIFDFICGNQATCSGIVANASIGVYGAYSMCNAEQKLGYVLDAYYKSQKSASGACDFQGQANLNKSPSVADNCKSALASASVANSIAATATSASATGTSGSKNLAGAGPSRTFLAMGDVVVGLYAVVAMAVGGAMVVL